MWGECGNAPGMFRINHRNHSGHRLYQLIRHVDFWVTNACREQVDSPNKHGRPDPAWLRWNLERLDYDLLLVCGRVARETYERCGFIPRCEVMKIKHPAARDWTKAEIRETQVRIREVLRGRASG
jgi:hypothetical protein